MITTQSSQIFGFVSVGTPWPRTRLPNKILRETSVILTGCSWRWHTDSLIYLEEKGDTGTSNHVCLHCQRKRDIRPLKPVPLKKHLLCHAMQRKCPQLTWCSPSCENSVTLKEQDDTSLSMSREAKRALNKQQNKQQEQCSSRNEIISPGQTFDKQHLVDFDSHP